MPEALRRSSMMIACRPRLLMTLLRREPKLSVSPPVPWQLVPPMLVPSSLQAISEPVCALQRYMIGS